VADERSVTGSRFHSALRDLRVKAGLQQRELAQRIGVSRQTLGALESGESVPATSIALELARVLGCRVEDIFWLGEEESLLEAILVGRPDAPLPAAQGPRKRVAMAAVDDRWVAHLLDGEGAAASLAPADGVLAAGARRETGKRSVRVRPLRESKSLRENLFCAGCDPALALLAGHLGERWSGGRLHWVEAGSGMALDLLADRQVHVAGVHLYDEESGDYNVAPVRRRLGGRAMVLINLALWDQGLVVAPGNPRRIRGVADLARKGVRVVARESGTGSQELFNRLAAEEGVARKALEVVGVAHGHLAVAQAVAAGGADAGMATRAAAVSLGLEFLPLHEARFDLVIPLEWLEDDRCKRLIDVLQSARFKRDLGSLAGYGTARTGKIIAEVVS
jgi:putative molybdopterin biosynthesis protein